LGTNEKVDIFKECEFCGLATLDLALDLAQEQKFRNENRGDRVFGAACKLAAFSGSSSPFISQGIDHVQSHDAHKRTCHPTSGQPSFQHNNRIKD
jgi:hypothetical protein